MTNAVTGTKTDGMTDRKADIQADIQTDTQTDATSDAMIDVTVDVKTDSSDPRPVVAITLGDPAGIGPEICLKALNHPEVYDACRPLIVGDAAYLNALTQSGVSWACSVRPVKTPAEGVYALGTVDVLDVPVEGLDSLKMGEVQPAAGKAAVEWIRRAVALALGGGADSICTAPINKEAVVGSGYEGFRGHTELLGELTGVSDPLTMFVVDSLRILFLTRHVSLAKAVGMVTYERLEAFIPRCVQALTSLGIPNPHIAVAGLNPHSSDGGLFGSEEAEEIGPAVDDARRKGYNAVGPVPADSVFHQAKNGKYDAVISLYHDQGHIASKTLDFERTVSLTLGLPFIRSSVDHGTAFDIAGKNLASEVSMVEAILVAARYSGYRGT